MPTPILEAPAVSTADSPHAWVVQWQPVGVGAPATLAIRADAEGRRPAVARDEQRVVVFHGWLSNRHELLPGMPGSDAEIVLALLRRAENVPHVLRGPFGVIVWHLQTGELEVARDHHGLQPLYFARTGDGLACSPDVDALLELAGVSKALDPVALAEYLCQRYEPGDGTFFRDVRRVPPGSMLRVGRGRPTIEPYWDPHPPGHDVDWLDEEEIDEFPVHFSRAVARCATPGSAAVFLSGGLDSIAVAAEAEVLSRRSVRRGPLALSLAFSGAGADEQQTQTRVASQLNLPQVLVPFERAVGESRVVEAALRMGRGWPVPMWNLWAVAYRGLVEAGRERGIDTVLTGRGGDEWLTVSPYHAADLARSGRLIALARLLRTRQRSYQYGGWEYARHLLANRVIRPLGSAALDWLAPAWWHGRRRQRLNSRMPSWLAPDGRIRAEMDARLDRFIIEARPAQGFYLREARAMTRHPAIVGDLEEAHEFGRRLGVRMAHPFWDVDLSAFLARTPPQMLTVGERSKAPLRRLVAERLPGTEIAQQRKADASGFFRRLMSREFPRLWGQMNGARCLGDLGVVDPVALNRALAAWEGRRGLHQPGRAWEIMALESWARSRAH